MARSDIDDKILQILKKNPNQSSNSIYLSVEKAYKESNTVVPSLRTIQRHLTDLVMKEKLAPNISPGREQTYSLSQEKKKSNQIQQYLIIRFWKEEEEIEREAIHGDPIRAYKRAQLLISKLPKPFNQKPLGTLREVTEALEQAKENCSERKDMFSHLQSIQNEFQYLGLEGIPSLIQAVSQALHEMESQV